MDYSQYYSDALNERMAWMKLDTDFMHDFKVRRLSASADPVERYAAIGMYVSLIANMAAIDGHIYDLSDELGWQFIAADMGLDVDTAKGFVSKAVSVGLFDAQLWEESRKLASTRLLKEADETAQNKAAARVKAENMRKAKERK